jgi:hypothetical protein
MRNVDIDGLDLSQKLRHGGGDCAECRDGARYTVGKIRKLLKDEERNIELVTELGDKELLPCTTSVTWKCLIHNQTWDTTVGSVMSAGSGCKSCSSITKSQAERLKEYWLKIPAILYRIRCWNNDEEFYKIGLTVKAVKSHFKAKSDMPYEYEILEEIHTNKYDVVYLEDELKIKHHEFLYRPLIDFGGSITECFTKLLE